MPDPLISNVKTVPRSSQQGRALRRWWFPLMAALLCLGLALLALAVLELSLRRWWPQDTRIVGGDSGSLGIDDPELGRVLRPGAHAVVKSPEYLVDYRIGASGFRDSSPHPNPKPPNVTRLLLLGDSFTFGDGNNYDDIWPVILERRLTSQGLSVDVVKAGIPAYDTRTEVLLLERIFGTYRPDIVVLVFLPNDLFTNQRIRVNDDLLPDGAAGFRADKKSDLFAVGLTKRLLVSSDCLYVKLYMLTARRQYFTAPANHHVSDQINTTKDLLSRAAVYCRGQRAKFVVLSIPQQFQVIVKAQGYRLPGVDVDMIDRVFAEFAGLNRFVWIPVLDDLVKEYINTKKDLYFRLDGHLSPLGNRIVGERFTEEVDSLLGAKKSSGTRSEQPGSPGGE